MPTYFQLHLYFNYEHMDLKTQGTGPHNIFISLSSMFQHLEILRIIIHKFSSSIYGKLVFDNTGESEGLTPSDINLIQTGKFCILASSGWEIGKWGLLMNGSYQSHRMRIFQSSNVRGVITCCVLKTHWKQLSSVLTTHVRKDIHGWWVFSLFRQ